MVASVVYRAPACVAPEVVSRLRSRSLRRTARRSSAGPGGEAATTLVAVCPRIRRQFRELWDVNGVGVDARRTTPNGSGPSLRRRRTVTIDT